MRHSFNFILSVVILFSASVTLSYSADFNIKLRKTDINELKQQLMPLFKENINILTELLYCMEKGKVVDVCLNEYSHVIGGNKTVDKKRIEQLTNTIKQKISKDNIEQEKIIYELTKLLVEAEKVTQCLQKGNTANELKDCVLLFDKKS